MGKTERAVYAEKALSQIPRLLGNQDRNPFSPTYGCFHRDYWLDKTSDFPDAVRQFGVHSLALVFAHDFPGNIYKGKEKILEWTVAGMMFWCRIQHKEGSFDEFYPYERGWVGPTAFTTFAVAEAYRILQPHLKSYQKEKILESLKKAAYFIIGGESEEDHLANHHAMACLAVWKVYRLLNDEALKEGYERLWKGFCRYHVELEGWSREYDGVDPGYLSATVSFLGKIYQDNGDPRILEKMEQSIRFCSYFVYPDGFYAGTLGSRNTLHFYPHGFEVFAGELPLAASIAEKMLSALSEGKLVPPGIMSDRYVFYRVPEYLQAYLDYAPRPESLPALPYEREPFTSYFEKSGIWVKRTADRYHVANLSKGGVLKSFDLEAGKIVCNDAGILGELVNGKVVSSQWIDPSFDVEITASGWRVSGNLVSVPGNKLFTPLKHIMFRLVLLLIGWHPGLAHGFKGWIRKVLILGSRLVPIPFSRSLRFEGERAVFRSEVRLPGKTRFRKIRFGDDFSVRYVPQSRYFQAQELESSGEIFEGERLELLKPGESLVVEREV